MVPSHLAHLGFNMFFKFCNLTDFHIYQNLLQAGPRTDRYKSSDMGAPINGRKQMGNWGYNPYKWRQPHSQPEGVQLTLPFHGSFGNQYSFCLIQLYPVLSGVRIHGTTVFFATKVYPSSFKENHQKHATQTCF